MIKKQQLHINGGIHTVEADTERSLLSVLRDDLDLIGTKFGCGEGQCGACTVLIDGQPTRSCLTPVGAVASRHILTIEGLAKNDQLHPVQEAFLVEDAMQCGYCTSGMILAAVALLQKTPHPTDAEIVSAMQGNLCRCGTYLRIKHAIQRAARTPRAQGRAAK
jgi:aerobic-type carbon monoxide dehydrogenase small subunit (CoxS/CutS family)